MADKATELSIILRAKDQASKVLRQTKGQILALRRVIRDNADQIRTLSKGFLATSAAGAVLFTGAIAQATQYEQSIANVRAVTASTSTETRLLSEAAREMGATSAHSASQAAEAQLFLGQAGLKTRQIIETLPGVMDLASAGGVDLAFATQLATATMSAFNLEASDSSRIANVFAAASSNSQANLDKLANAMRQVGPVANSLGESVESTTAALNLLFDSGFRGEQAGTALRGAFASLLKPSGEAAELIDRLGIRIQDADGKTRPFVDIVRQLEAAQLSANDAFVLFGTEGAPAMLAIASKGADELERMEQAITGTNEAARQAAARLDSLAGEFTILKSAVQEILITVGDKLLPVVKAVVFVVNTLADAFNALPDMLKNIAIGFGLAITGMTGFLAALGFLALILSPLIPVLASMGVSLSAAGVAIVVVTGLIASLSALVISVTDFFKNWGTATDEVTERLNKLKQRLEDQNKTMENTRKKIEEVKKENLRLLEIQNKLNTPEHKKAVEQLNREFEAGKITQEQLNRQLEIAQKFQKELREKMKGATEGAKDHAKAVQDAAAEHKRLAEEAEKATKKLEEQEKAAQALKAAFQRLGIKNLASEAEELQQAFDLIRQSGEVSAEDIERAYAALQLRLEELTDKSALYRDALQNELTVLQQRKAIAEHAYADEIAALEGINQMIDQNRQSYEQAIESIKALASEIKQIAFDRKALEFEISLKGLSGVEQAAERIKKAQQELNQVRAQGSRKDLGSEKLDEQIKKTRSLIDLSARLAQSAIKDSENERKSLELNRQAGAELERLLSKKKQGHEDDAEGLERQAEQFAIVRNGIIETLEPLEKYKELISSLKAVIDLTAFDEAQRKAEQTRAKFEAAFSKPIIQEIRILERRVSSGEALKKDGEGASSDKGSGEGKKPGFATGIRFVPRDMDARLHRGEIVLNRTDANAFRSGALRGSGVGGGLVIGNININVPGGRGIDRNTVRQVIIPELERAARRNPLSFLKPKKR